MMYLQLIMIIMHLFLEPKIHPLFRESSGTTTVSIHQFQCYYSSSSSIVLYIHSPPFTIMVSSSGTGASANADGSVARSGEPALHVKKLSFVTLTKDNYVSWKAQTTCVLIGTDLLKYVDSEVELSDSPVYLRQYQLLLGWLFQALSPDILSQVASLTSSAEVWKALAMLYSSGSITRILFLWRQFLTVKKGAMSMSAYIAHVKTLLDELQMVGEKKSEADKIITVVGGLGPEYSAFSTSITTRFDPTMTFVDLQALLTDLELHQPEENQSLLSSLAANVASAESKSASSMSHLPSAANANVKNYPCQICNRKGHGALNCFDRFNAKKFAPTHNRKLVAVGLSSHSANFASKQSEGASSVWYPDSGASTHDIGIRNNLQLTIPYNGPTTIAAANGDAMRISHSGKSEFSNG